MLRLKWVYRYNIIEWSEIELLLNSNPIPLAVQPLPRW